LDTTDFIFKVLYALEIENCRLSVIHHCLVAQLVKYYTDNGRQFSLSRDNYYLNKKESRVSNSQLIWM
jgi:hypothetical protein